jgi:YfiH family protein
VGWTPDTNRQSLAGSPWQLRRSGGLFWLQYEGWEHRVCLFSTRRGGSSLPPYASLNLSRSVGDRPGVVHQNREAFLNAVGIDHSSLVILRQRHTARVRRARWVRGPLSGDAVFTNEAGQYLVVSVADCLPVYVNDPVSGAIGLAHAGWRGTIEGIVASLLEEMAAHHGSDPADCQILFGPSIGPYCYQIGADVADRFMGPEGAAIVVQQDQTMVDLEVANRIHLVHMGVSESNVVRSGLCTSCMNDLFFSYRRDRGVTGRMWAIFGITKKQVTTQRSRADTKFPPSPF